MGRFGEEMKEPPVTPKIEQASSRTNDIITTLGMGGALPGRRKKKGGRKIR